jgi:thymidylate synthase
MKVFEVRNAAEALPQVIDYLVNHGAYENSRNGKVFVAKTPVMTVYSHPQEKVLFSPVRDANPFFALLESCWMLAGCNDAKFLNYYVRDFGDRYGENGILHGAYGYRWRRAFGFDQLKTIIEKFKENPYDRQCVLQMWETTESITFDRKRNHYEEFDDLRGKFKDKPCHTQVYFRINDDKLDMTTTARSHDCYWGATNANATHFGFLQEYLAGMIGIPTGKFYQFSHNYHLYDDILKKLLSKLPVDNSPVGSNLIDNRYESEEFYQIPLITNPATFDEELQELLMVIRRMQEGVAIVPMGPQDNDFLWETVYLMALSHYYYKQKNYDEALKIIMYVKSGDWMLAGREWIERRIK